MNVDVRACVFGVIVSCRATTKNCILIFLFCTKASESILSWFIHCVFVQKMRNATVDTPKLIRFDVECCALVRVPSTFRWPILHSISRTNRLANSIIMCKTMLNFFFSQKRRLGSIWHFVGKRLTLTHAHTHNLLPSSVQSFHFLTRTHTKDLK